jgi:sulfatase maturation enzyme AslB (radical SAM superfamily)
MNETPLCMMPWFHQEVETDGRMKPCCYWSNITNDTDEYDHVDFFHGKFMQDLRDKFSKGEMPKNCDNCLYYEKINGNSLRQNSFHMAKYLGVDHQNGPRLVSQEINLSNRCNLACRYCSSARSTRWNLDAHLRQNKTFKNRANWTLTDDQAHTVRRLNFLGGESMLHQKDIVIELNKMRDRGTLSQCHLHINSNLTIPFRDDFVQCMLESRKTSIDASIDAVGPLNSYARSYSNWNMIEKNLLRYRDLCSRHDNLSLGLTCTYSVLNAHAFVELVEWWSAFSKTIHVSLVLSPLIYNACNLPHDEKSRLIDHYESLKHKDFISREINDSYNRIINHLKSAPVMDLDTWKAKFKSVNDALDQSRNCYLIDANPRLHEIVNAAG